MAAETSLPAFCAFEAQLKTLCLKEFPCGLGSWRENGKSPKKISLAKTDKVASKFSVTLKDYDSNHLKTESLEEFLSSKRSPWNQDYSWSEEAKGLREIAVKSPWLIDENFVLAHFKTLRIVDKGVSEVDPNLLCFPNLHELTLTANKLRTIKSENLPQSLQVLEVCANHISNLADLCICPPPLIHLGLGHNLLTMVDEYITGEYWPHLLSLDLSHNNLSDLMDIVRKLQTVPKLRNLLLQGNPLSLIPGYRGYVIDSLRNLDFLDDVSISADEKHHYKGLTRRKEYILDEAKVHLHVDYIRGILQPEELKNPDDIPEFPIITRNYYVQFDFLEDKSANAEIFRLMDDDNLTLTDRQTEDGMTMNTAGESALAPPSEAGQASNRSQGHASQGHRSQGQGSQSNRSQGHASQGHRSQGQGSQSNRSQQLASKFSDKADSVTVAEGGNTQRSQSVMPESEAIFDGTLNAHTKSGNSLGSQAGTEQEMVSGPVVRLAPLRSASSTWQEEMELNWHGKQTRDDLLSLRDFLLQGMDISVMEEKILSYPADQVQDGVVTPVVKEKGKGDKKKDDKKKDEPAKEDVKKKKKKGEPDIDLVHMPGEYTQLATFHVPLADFLEGDYVFENVYTKSWQECSGTTSVMSDVTTLSKKDKKKDKKEAKDNRKSPRADKKSPKVERKMSVKDKGDKGKSKTVVPDGGDDEPPPPPSPLQVHIKVKLHHWRTAMDSLKDEQEEARETQQAEGN